MAAGGRACRGCHRWRGVDLHATVSVFSRSGANRAKARVGCQGGGMEEEEGEGEEREAWLGPGGQRAAGRSGRATWWQLGLWGERIESGRGLRLPGVK